ncbi:MAG TPA: response regulator [Flavisolibacter sp.]|jgi:CheY-like chemotaxis protein|nr:response regulator [Flavisolibacter sp.]
MQTDRHSILKILLIDDDEDDYIVFKLAISEVDDSIQLLYCNCADNISQILAQTRPQLIFLDINLPRINGIECLQQLQNDTIGKTIPVVMYSSSELPRDLQLSFDSGASLYFRKPTDVSKLISSLKEIFAMDWNQPGVIRAKYLIDGRYKAFSTEENT